MWNSGRLPSISATVSPRPTPSRASPPASASTRSRSCDQVRLTSSSFVRTATRSGLSSTVSRNASVMVWAPTARRSFVSPMGRTLSDREALSGQAPDVVRQPDNEQRDHQREADEPGALHDAERDRATAQLLGQRPEDVAAVERQEREQVDDPERQRDHREQEQRAVGAEVDRLPRRLVRADDAGDLLALLLVEDPRDRLDRALGEDPHPLDAAVGGLDDPDAARQRLPAEPDQRASQVGVVLR